MSEKKSTVEDLKEMIELRNKGWGYVRIAKRFKVHHSTIIYHLQRVSGKRGIRQISLASQIKGTLSPIKSYYFHKETQNTPDDTRKFFLSITNRPKEHPLLELERLIPVRGGKTYKEHLEEARRRTDPMEKARKRAGDKFADFI